VILIPEHLTDRVSKARVALELRRSVRPAIMFVIGIAVAAACAIYMAGRLPGGSGSQMTVSFEVRDASGLVANRDEIRFKGIPAGTVEAVKLDRGVARVVGTLSTRFGKLHRDGKVQVRPNTALQDMFIDIVDPGTTSAPVVTKKAPLPASQVASSVRIGDVLRVFDQNTQVSMATTLSELGRGLRDRGAALRTAFVQLAPFLDVAGRISRAIVRRDAATRRLVSRAASLTTELGDRDRQLRTLVHDGAVMLKTLQANDPSLDGTVRELAPTLQRLRTSFAAVSAVLPDVDNAVQELGPVSREVPTALRAIRRLSDTAQPAVSALRPAVRSLVPLAAVLPPLSGNLKNAVVAAQPQIPSLDRATQEFASCGDMLQRFFLWTASTFAMGDAKGVGPRGDAAFSVDSLGRLADPRVKEAPACAGGQASDGVQPAVRPGGG
jgi:phospholipid/cholesterol/gamma-HCH transport system substrate-binding protein